MKAVWAAMPADVSFLHFLFYIASAGKLDLLLDTEGGAQQDRFVEGAGTLAATGRRDARRPVVLSAPVRRIEWTADAARVHGDGVEVRAQRVIVAMPPTLAGRIWYDPPLPGYRDQLTQRMPMGAVIKCFAVYDEPFWRAEGLSGSAVSADGPAHADLRQLAPRRRARDPGRLPRGPLGARARAGSSEAERRAAVLGEPGPHVRPARRAPGALPRQELGRRGVEPRLLRGLHAAGVLTAFGPALREPIGPLHWAGTETATRWNGYIDGALQSGERAAREVLAAAPARSRAGRGCGR